MNIFHIPTLAISSLFLLLLSLSSPIASADFFRDSNGNPVINGGKYYISRKDPAPDEGPITWVKSSKTKQCPLYVIQSYYPMNMSMLNSDSCNDQTTPDSSITIRSPLRSLYIPLNTPIEITFNDQTTPCKKPLKWSVKRAAKPINAYYIVAGYDNPGYKFRVKDGGQGSEYVYRLEYCLNDSKTCLEVGNANKFPEDKKGVFGITSEPESINFWALDFFVAKVSSSASAD